MEVGQTISIEGKEYKIEDIVPLDHPGQFELILYVNEDVEIERNIFGKLWYGFWFSIYYPTINKIKELPGTNLPSITDQLCQCRNCGWSGTVWDCEGDVDSNGNLGCPKCLTVIEVIV